MPNIYWGSRERSQGYPGREWRERSNCESRCGRSDQDGTSTGDQFQRFGNDYGYENWMAKALEFYGDSGDVAVIISSSGQSQNVVIGANAARDIGLHVVTLSGFRANNPLRMLGDLNLWVNSESYNVVETTHQSWLLAVIDRLVETGQ